MLGTQTPISWEILLKRARWLASMPYREPPDALGSAADFDASVRLGHGKARAIAGTLRLLPAIRAIAPKAVSIALVEGDQARTIIHAAGLFPTQENAAPAGFRLMTPDGKSDWLAFLGASYFRTAGGQDQYGISARGIAIDTGLAEIEEFPGFTHFWCEPIGTDRARIHALLDGPSLTGAYAFDCMHLPGQIVMEVQATLFLRKDVVQLGLAPASSMFWYDQIAGRDRRPGPPDWRPEIHDSDGLAILAGNGERIWRPLANPPTARLNALRADGVRGFGLLQRDRVFDHYQDDGAFYNRRPSLWIEPKGDWGPGAVCLFEMPSDSETNDNVALFWRGDRPGRAGDRIAIAYRLTWTSSDSSADGNARCLDIFAGASGIPGAPPRAGARKLVFDFGGTVLTELDRQSGVEAITNLPAPALLASAAYPVAGQQARWRVMLDILPEACPAPELRLFLCRGGAALSETVILPVQG